MSEVSTALSASEWRRPESVPRTAADSEVRQSLDGDDERIIRDFFEGSERERARLYQHILPLCRSTIRRMVGSSHREAEDLLQTAVERVVSTLVYGTFSRHCSLRTWAVAITRNVVRNEVRAERRDQKYLVEEDLETCPDAEALLCAIEQKELRGVLLRLPRQMAVALLLHDLCGYTAAEIAAKFELTSAGAQSRIWRARELARRHLERGSWSRPRSEQLC